MFKMMKSVSVAALVLSLTSLGACKRSEEETNRKLDLLISKIDGLDKKIAAGGGRGAAGAPGAAPQRRRADPAVTYFLPVSEADAIKGPKTAKVTVVEAFEFACPYCAMLHGPMEAAAEKNKDVRFVAKQYVIHPDTATLPALGACAATKQGKWEQYEEALWAKSWPQTNGQPSFKKEELSAENLEKIAKEIGMDVNRFKADRDGTECKAQLDKTRTELSAVGVTGTPAIYINGKPYQGQRTPDALSAAIDEARKAADAAIGKNGVTADNYYDSIMKTAQKTM